jgi:hypothetical protein
MIRARIGRRRGESGSVSTPFVSVISTHAMETSNRAFQRRRGWAHAYLEHKLVVAKDGWHVRALAYAVLGSEQLTLWGGQCFEGASDPEDAQILLGDLGVTVRSAPHHQLDLGISGRDRHLALPMLLEVRPQCIVAVANVKIDRILVLCAQKGTFHVNVLISKRRPHCR